MVAGEHSGILVRVSSDISEYIMWVVLRDIIIGVVKLLFDDILRKYAVPLFFRLGMLLL